MIFANEKVRAYLLKHGIVYSFRMDHPKTSDGVRKQIGNDWAAAYRTGPKIADIHITPMEPVHEDNLFQVLPKYARESGFYLSCIPGKADAWVTAIEQLNKNKPIQGWIYKVTLREGRVK
ncbi:hypothetical protein LCGC14_2622430 [marine sediment metagenome]|uniref:Uncharacterized protein n=1 Tax=marine sediment metagenome TaxID=412755 RepID=A0A0F9A2M1_9ZZZZ